MPAGGAAGAPLTLPSAARFVGIWAPGNERCPLTLQDFVIIHNFCVKMRTTATTGWNELSGYTSKVHQFLKTWPHRLKQIKAAFRIECVDGENADMIPPLFLKTWNKEQSANAQDDFIKEAYARTLQLAHICADQSFSDFYEATYRKMPSLTRIKLATAEELECLGMICILEYKFLAGCDKQWRERPAEPSNFLREGDADADQDAAADQPLAAAASPTRRGRSVAAADAASANTGSKKSAAEAAPASAAPAGKGGSKNADSELEGDIAAAPAGEEPDLHRKRDINDIVNWGLNDDEFPLNQLDDMKFDPLRPLAAQRIYYAAAVLLFYRKRTKEQEKVFRELSGLWGEVRSSHICHTQLCAPPSAGATLYSPDEAKWCSEAQKALIAKMDDALRKELEIAEPAQDSISGKKGRARGEALEGQGALLQPAK